MSVRRTLWNMRAVEEALQRLFGPEADFRSQDQRNGFRLIIRCRAETLIVMPIDSGKSLLFIVFSQLPGAQITIVIVSLIALRYDLILRCQAWGVLCATYDSVVIPQRLHAISTLLVVDIYLATTQEFVAFVEALQRTGRLD